MPIGDGAGRSPMAAGPGRVDDRLVTNEPGPMTGVNRPAGADADADADTDAADGSRAPPLRGTIHWRPSHRPSSGGRARRGPPVTATNPRRPAPLRAVSRPPPRPRAPPPAGHGPGGATAPGDGPAGATTPGDGPGGATTPGGRSDDVGTAASERAGRQQRACPAAVTRRATVARLQRSGPPGPPSPAGRRHRPGAPHRRHHRARCRLRVRHHRRRLGPRPPARSWWHVPIARQRSGRVFGGVLAGIAAAHGIDVKVARVVVGLGAFVFPPTIPLYIAAWLLLPRQPEPGRAPADLLRGGGRTWVVVGLALLAFLAFMDGGWGHGPGRGGNLLGAALLLGLGAWLWSQRSGSPPAGPAHPSTDPSAWPPPPAPPAEAPGRRGPAARGDRMVAGARRQRLADRNDATTAPAGSAGTAHRRRLRHRHLDRRPGAPGPNPGRRCRRGSTRPSGPLRRRHLPVRRSDG